MCMIFKVWTTLTMLQVLKIHQMHTNKVIFICLNKSQAIIYIYDVHDIY